MLESLVTFSSPALANLEMPEVEHLHHRRSARAMGQKQVRRLQVAVDDAERVRLGERLARLEEVPDRLVARQRAPRTRPRARGPGPPGTPSRCKGRRLRASPRRARGRRARSRASRRPGPRGRIAPGTLEHLGEEKLQSHRTIELDLRGGDHDPHSPGPQRAVDPVLSPDHLPRPHRTDFFGHTRSWGGPGRLYTEPRARARRRERKTKRVNRYLSSSNRGAAREERRGFVTARCRARRARPAAPRRLWAGHRGPWPGASSPGRRASRRAPGARRWVAEGGY